MSLVTGPILASAPDPLEAYLKEKQAPDMEAYIKEKRLASMAQGVTPTAALGSGAAQGATVGFGDEAQGAIQSLVGRLLPQKMGGFGPEHKGTIAQDYSLNRDTAREENAAARQAHPGMYLGGEVAGGLAPALLGGAATGTLSTAAGVRPVLAAAGQGALQGAGFSDANTARGLARDSALGGVLGTAGYGAGQAAGAVGSKLSGALAGIRAKAAARAAQQAADEEGAKVATLAGKYGGEVQKGSRQVENLMRLEASMTPEQKALYAELQGGARSTDTSPWQAHVTPDSMGKTVETESLPRLLARGNPVQSLKEQVAGSTLKALPDQAATIAGREAELRAAQAALPQSVASRTAELSTPQFGKDAASFFKSYGEPLVWGALGAGAGHAAGLSPEQTAILGAVAGGIGGRTRAGKALISRLTRPGNVIGMADAGSATAEGAGELLRQLLQRAAPPLATQSIVSGQ